MVIKILVIALIPLPVLWLIWYILHTAYIAESFKKRIDDVQKPCPVCGQPLTRWHTEYTFGADCNNCGYESFIG